MPTTTSATTSRAQTDCSICYGFAYFNKAMEGKRGLPNCVGVRLARQGTLRADPALLPPHVVNYKFACLGLCASPVGDAADSSSSGSDAMPRCQGLQMISVVSQSSSNTAAGQQQQRGQQLDGTHGSSSSSGSIASAAAARVPSGNGPAAVTGVSLSSSSSSDGSRQSSPDPSSAGSSEGAGTSLSDRFVARMNKNLEAMAAMLRNEGPLKVHTFHTAQDVSDRLWQMGARNAQKVENALSAAASYVHSSCSATWQSLLGGSGSGGGGGTGRGREDAGSA